MLTGQRKRRRGVAGWGVAGVVAIALVAVVGGVALARPLGFIHIRSNLSQTANLASARPDLAVSPDGNSVAVVWTEEYQSGVGDHKGHVYLRIASETGSGWGGKTRVFSGSDAESAHDAALAVSDTVAHVAYVVVRYKLGQENMQVRYRACSLASGECGTEQIVESVPYSSDKITWVDIALENSEHPHVVWSRTDQFGEDGVIWHAGNDGTGWVSPPPEHVSLAYGCYRPAIACANGYLHVVWEEDVEASTGDRHLIRYARWSSESGWETRPLCANQTFKMPGNPDVAAWGGRVFATWDWCSDLDPKPCDQYKVVYRYSEDDGLTWGTETSDTREVGTGRLYHGTEDLVEYASSDNEGIPPEETRHESLLDLQPSITMNSDGWPAVTWHADRSGGPGTDYVVYYTYIFTDGLDQGSWITPTVLGGQGTLRGAATIGIGQPASGEQHLHLAYMQQLGTGSWDVYYDSNEEDRYKYIRLPVVLRAD